MTLEHFDVRPYLVSASDMDAFEEDAETAADHLNGMIFAIAHECASSEFWTIEKTEQLVEEISEMWIREPGLVEAAPDELEDYVVHLIRKIEQEDMNEELDEQTDEVDEG